jgi:hypothetical protein
MVSHYANYIATGSQRRIQHVPCERNKTGPGGAATTTAAVSVDGASVIPALAVDVGDSQELCPPLTGHDWDLPITHRTIRLGSGDG